MGVKTLDIESSVVRTVFDCSIPKPNVLLAKICTVEETIFRCGMRSRDEEETIAFEAPYRFSLPKRVWSGHLTES